MMRGGIIHYCLTVGLILHVSTVMEMSHAISSGPPTIVKTFESDTLIEHTITARADNYEASLRLSRRRQAQGAPWIVDSHLAFQYDTRFGQETMPLSIFERLLTDLMTALQPYLGDGPTASHLMASGFMGVKMVALKNVAAFDGYAPWMRYVTDPERFTQLEIHTLVHHRWTEAGVFAAIDQAFRPLGYTATFSGFEKLFVIPAGTCSFYPELRDLGVQKTDRFPYPGSISFNLNRIHRQPSANNTSGTRTNDQSNNKGRHR